MSLLDRTPAQRQCLRRQLVEARDARLFRRMLALLPFDRGPGAHARRDAAE